MKYQAPVYEVVRGRRRRVPRDRMAGHMVKEVQAGIRAIARQSGCSVSFVVHVACADFLKIDVERYDEPKRNKSKHRRS